MRSPAVKALKSAVVRNHQSNPDSAVILGIQLYKLSLKSEEVPQISYAAGSLGMAYYYKKDFENARHYTELAIKMEHATSDRKMLPVLYRSLGIIYYDNGYMNRALQQFNLGLKYVEKGSFQHCLLLNSFGYLYNTIKEYKKAVPYFEECIRYTLQSKDHSYLKLYYATLSSVQLNIDLAAAKKTLDIGNKIKGEDINEENNTYTLLYATYYLKTKAYGQALSYANKALQTSFTNKNHQQTITALSTLAEIKLAEGKLEQAREFAEKALAVGKQNGMFLDLRGITDLLLKIYEKQNKDKVSFEVLKLHMSISDSINKNALAEYELRNQFENKILNDSVKSANQRKITALRYTQQINTQKTIIWTAVILAIMLVLLIVYVFKNYQKKQRINKFISWKNTVLIQQNQEVQNHVSQLLGAVESARDFIAYSKDAFAFSYTNSAGKKLLKFPDSETQSYAYTDIFEDETLDFLKEAFEVSSKLGFYSGEAIFKLRNGNIFPVLLNVVCHKNKYGDVNQYSMIARDITYLKDYQQKITHQNVQLQKANGELDRFVYSISHDLRAPLISVVGVLEIIENEFYPEDTNFHFYLSMLRSGLMRTDDSIKNILEYSKNVSETVKVSPVLMGTIIEKVKEEFCELIAQNNIEISLELDDRIPFYSDSTRIQTLLHNLFDNAIKYQRALEKNKKVTIKFKSEIHQATLSVIDNGIGMQAGPDDKIFEMFYRGTNLSSGSGLGLYIVKQIADLLEAEIVVSTVYGEKTEFKIVFPNLKPNGNHGA